MNRKERARAQEEGLRNPNAGSNGQAEIVGCAPDIAEARFRYGSQREWLEAKKQFNAMLNNQADCIRTSLELAYHYGIKTSKDSKLPKRWEDLTPCTTY